MCKAVFIFHYAPEFKIVIYKHVVIIIGMNPQIKVQVSATQQYSFFF